MTPDDISLDWLGTIPVSLALMLLSPGIGHGMKLTSALGTSAMTRGKLGIACPPAETELTELNTTLGPPENVAFPPSAEVVCTASPGTQLRPWQMGICD